MAKVLSRITEPRGTSAALSMLPHPWIVIPDRPIDLAECTIIHQVYGIGLINPVRADITDAFLAWLMRERFGEYFPGTIPVLVIAIDSDDIDKISQFLSDTFLECVVTVENEGWADGMSELLLRQRNPLPPETCKPVDLSDLAIQSPLKCHAAEGIPTPILQDRFIAPIAKSMRSLWRRYWLATAITAIAVVIGAFQIWPPPHPEAEAVPPIEGQLTGFAPAAIDKPMYMRQPLPPITEMKTMAVPALQFVAVSDADIPLIEPSKPIEAKGELGQPQKNGAMAIELHPSSNAERAELLKLLGHNQNGCALWQRPNGIKVIRCR